MRGLRSAFAHLERLMSSLRNATLQRYSGLLTDLYELTMAAAYVQTNLAARATFELFARHLPPHRNYLVAAGLEQAGGDRPQERLVIPGQCGADRAGPDGIRWHSD